MTAIFANIESSFRKIMKGEEAMNTVIWWWGVLAYIFSYFVADKLVKKIDFRSVDLLISALMLIYFIWHLYALKKCSPKKPVLTKEEKKRLKEEAHRQWGRKFLRKLFLQEPITEFNPVVITAVLDLFCAAHYTTYIFR